MANPSEQKFTEGPWKVGELERLGDWAGDFRRIHQDEQFGDIVGFACVKHPANHSVNERGEANAALISAAPDLYEALQAALPYIEALTYSGHRPPTVTEAKRVKALIEAALTKAGL